MIRAVILLMWFPACASVSETGMAGCWEDVGGKYRYADRAPKADGFCPSLRELVRFQDAQVGVDPCPIACRLILLRAQLGR